MNDKYLVTAYWGPRHEEPEALAQRFLRMVAALKRINRLLDGWLLWDDSDLRPVASMTPQKIARLISDGVSRGDEGNPTPITGYFFRSLSEKRSNSTRVIIDAHIGSAAVANYFINAVHLEFAPLDEINAALIDICVIRPALLVMASIWDATWCGVRSTRMYELEPSAADRRRPWFGLAWMTYLSARFARMVAPPHSAIVEHVSGGGLLMVATEERFDVDNAKHMAVAREIETALAPVNALPWPPDR